MIQIDGARGEGGGQILRTSLTLSMLTGKDLRIYNIRARRKTPGLRPQHLKAVQAAAAVCDGDLQGAAIGSQEIEFYPGEVRAGNYRFDIGTAGATSLVLQTIFLPLSRASASSKVTITGGTHVPWSPCFHYLDLQWLPYLRAMGVDADLEIVKAGFYPQGGGEIRCQIHPTRKLLPLNLLDRGQLRQVSGISAVANLPRKIAERQRQRVVARIGHKYPLNDLRIVDLPARFKGTLLLLLGEFENTTCCFFGLGALGKPAEKVADEAMDALETFLAVDGAVDPYLADQLLLPLAFADGPSKFTTTRVTQHLSTNAAVIRQFLAVDIRINGELSQPGIVQVMFDQFPLITFP